MGCYNRVDLRHSLRKSLSSSSLVNLIEFIALLSLLNSTIGFVGVASAYSYRAPQYVLLNLAPAENWNQEDPSTFSRFFVDQMLESFTSLRSPNGGRRLGFSFLIYYSDSSNLTTLAQSLRNGLNVAVETNVPVWVCLDGYAWWSAQSQLWNWFDADSPGYNPDNVNNVEWTGWNLTSAQALMLSWRNWGYQLRVPTPHPNLASPAFIKECANGMQYLMDVLLDWYFNTLTSDEQRLDLFAGLKVGSEVWIGSNYYYYPNGNALLNSNPANDPTTGIAGSVQLGYASVLSLLGESSIPSVQPNSSITSEQLDLVVQNYLEIMSNIAVSASLSPGSNSTIPKWKIFAHSGCQEGSMMPSNLVWNTFNASNIQSAFPAWSIYTYAYNPGDIPNFGSFLQTLEYPPWVAGEFYYFGGNSGSVEEQWIQSLNNTLSFLNNRALDIFNWQSMVSSSSNSSIIAAIQTIINTDPPCLVDVASLSSAQINGTSFRLSWDVGADTDQLTLLISSSSETETGNGKLSNDIAQIDVTNQSDHIFVLPTTISYYWMLVSVGCGGTQTMVSNVEMLTLV